MTKEEVVHLIPLTRGRHAIVDKDDWEELRKHKWCAAKFKRSDTFYAMRCVCRRGKRETVYMHREILGLRPGDGKHIDHLNHNGCDNRRQNLRVCTHRENHENLRQSRNLPTGIYFQAVCTQNPYHAQFSLKHRTIHVGNYPTVELAVEAREAALREIREREAK